MTVHNTKEDIRNSFIELYKTNKISSITVDMICKNAFISRSTFYKFYKNIENVEKEIEDDIINLIIRIREETSYQDIFSLAPETPAPALVAMTRFLLENKDYFTAAFSDHGSPTFNQRYRNLNLEFMNTFATENHVPEEMREVAANIVCDALLAMQRNVLKYHQYFDEIGISLGFKNMIISLTSKIRDNCILPEKKS